MSNRIRCSCQSCTIRSFTGPAMVITVGVLFLLDQVVGGKFYFGSTWPVILIVAGLLQLASSIASRDGHIAPQPPIAPPPPAPPVPPVGTSQTPYSSQGH